MVFKTRILVEGGEACEVSWVYLSTGYVPGMFRFPLTTTNLDWYLLRYGVDWGMDGGRKAGGRLVPR